MLTLRSTDGTAFNLRIGKEMAAHEHRPQVRLGLGVDHVMRVASWALGLVIPRAPGLTGGGSS